MLTKMIFKRLLNVFNDINNTTISKAVVIKDNISIKKIYNLYFLLLIFKNTINVFLLSSVKNKL